MTFPHDLRVLGCGGRDYNDAARVFEILDRIDPTVVCHGGARGADYLIGLWAASSDTPCTVFPADWRAFGRRAGVMRNKIMLDEFEPDLVVAFPGGRGTESMMTLARAAKVKILQVTG